MVNHSADPLAPARCTGVSDTSNANARAHCGQGTVTLTDELLSTGARLGWCPGVVVTDRCRRPPRKTAGPGRFDPAPREGYRTGVPPVFTPRGRHDPPHPPRPRRRRPPHPARPRETGDTLAITWPDTVAGAANFGTVMAAAFDPKGEKVGFGTADGSLWLWDPTRLAKPDDEGRTAAAPVRVGRHVPEDGAFNY